MRKTTDVAFRIPLILGAMLCAGTCGAAMEPFGTGARATGLGEAFVAVADDMSSIDHNTAGLATLTAPTAAAQYADFLGKTDATDRVAATNLSGALPLNGGRNGVIAAGFRRFQASSFFTDQALRLAYGAMLPNMGDQVESVSVGGAITRFSRVYGDNAYASNAVDDHGEASGQSDPALAGGRGTGGAYGVDLGLLCRFGTDGETSLGAAISNLNRPDLSLNGDGDRAPRIVRIGAARRVRNNLISVEARRQFASPAASAFDLAAGAETWLPIGVGQKIGLRGGYAQGSGAMKTAYAGLSAAFSSFRLDYAFEIPLGAFADAGINHHITLSWTPAATPR